jgi:leucine dehydrogenase
MTYKNALAGLPLGGGKSVVLAGDEPADREKLFLAHGRAVDRLGGSYLTAEDVGTSTADMEILARATKWVAGRDTGGGDPSPWTARGVFRALEAAAVRRWGSRSLEGRRVAIQGCGNVGRHFAGECRRAGASLVVADVVPTRAARIARDEGAEIVDVEEIFGVDADIFAPCALGAILDDATIPRLRASIVVGAANNQLLDERHGDDLDAREILYVPDYVANAGGVLSGGVDIFGWSHDESRRRIEAIYETTLEVLDLAATEGIATSRAADRLAEARLA